MSDHPYGQLRNDSIDLHWKHTTYKHSWHCEKHGPTGPGLSFIIQPDSSKWFGSYDINLAVPDSLQALEAWVNHLDEEENRKEAERQAYMASPEFKRRQLEGKIHEMERVTAVMDERGFHVITPEEREQKLANLRKQLAELTAPTPAVGLGYVAASRSGRKKG